VLAKLASGWIHPDREAAWELAERALVDTVAVALAASSDPTVTIALDALGGSASSGPSTVLTTGRAADARQAALLGGLAAHALDFDDVDDAMIGHPSAVLIPAVLAVAEEQDLPGEALLDAYWVGLATCRAIAGALGIDGHYGKGWHSTATIGTLASAAAVARLRGLSLDQTQHALGIAGSLAAGSRQNFGTMTKPLHAGTAASNGVLAATLAAAGFTADQEQLERPLGFLALHHGSPDPALPEATALEAVGLNVKLYPCCYYIHSAADALRELRLEGLIDSDVESVHVTVQPAGLGPLIHHRPRTGLQGKFSMEYASAAVLLDGDLRLPTFTDEQVNRSRAQDLLRCVTLEESEVPPVGPREWNTGYAVVRVTGRDGRVQERRVDRPRGHATRPVGEAELRAKFDDALAFAGLASGDRLYDGLRGLRAVGSVRDLTRQLRDLVTRSATAAGAAS
jgi:2-methylcitrate dehydratase PrpD